MGLNLHSCRPRNIDITAAQFPSDEDPDAGRARRSLRHQLRRLRVLPCPRSRGVGKGHQDPPMRRMHSAPEEMRQPHEKVPPDRQGTHPVLPRVRQIPLQPPGRTGRPLPVALPDKPGQQSPDDKRKGDAVIFGLAAEEVAMSQMRRPDILPQRPLLFLRPGGAPEEEEKILLGRPAKRNAIIRQMNVLPFTGPSSASRA